MAIVVLPTNVDVEAGLLAGARDRFVRDRRPAWEVVDDFEQEVERILSGDPTLLVGGLPPRDPSHVESRLDTPFEGMRLERELR